MVVLEEFSEGTHIVGSVPASSEEGGGYQRAACPSFPPII